MRTLAAAASADAALVLWAADSDIAPGDVPETLPAVRLRSKIDLRPGAKTADGWIGISCFTGDGLADLRRELQRFAAEWPARVFAPAESRAFSTHVSTADLMRAAADTWPAGLRYWARLLGQTHQP